MLAQFRLGLASLIAGDLASGRDEDDPRWWDGAIAATASGVSVNVDTLFALPVARDCIMTAAGAISSLPVDIYEVHGRGETRLTSDHPIADLLSFSPNPTMTAAEFWNGQIVDYLAEANAFTEIAPGPRGWADTLWPIAADRVNGCERTGSRELVYRVGQGGGSAAQIELPGERVMHVKAAPYGRGGLFGRPLYETARETFGKAVAVSRYGALYFRNFAGAGGEIEHETPFKNKEQEERFLAQFEAHRTGGNAHRPFLMPTGWKYNSRTINNNEAQFLETKRDCDLDICRLLGTPPHKVGILENTTFNNIEHQSIQYSTDTIVPIVTLFEQAARLRLLTRPDRYLVRFNIAALLRGDQKARFESYRIGLLSGFITINEVRRAEGLNGIGAQGDVLLRPLNMDTVTVKKVKDALAAGDVEGAADLIARAVDAGDLAFVPVAHDPRGEFKHAA